MQTVKKYDYWLLLTVLPLIAKEYAIWVEHWNNLEDKILSEAVSDIMRRHKKVNQSLQNGQLECFLKLILFTVILLRQISKITWTTNEEGVSPG